MTRATSGPTTRRAVLAGACATCAAGVLAACGTTTAPSGSGTASGRATPAPGTALTSTADVPVGGGTVLADQGIVVVQPSAGSFAAYSARCTHTGCTVGEVAGGTIICPCHGSTFALDGSVVTGPARTGLGRRAVTVTGGMLTLA